MSRRTPRAALLAATLFLLFGGTARAVTFQYTAQVTSFDNQGSIPGVGIGTNISGFYVFDGATPQVPDDPGVGLYRNAMRFSAGVELPSGLALAITPPNHNVQNTEIRTNDRAINATEDESYRATMENLIAGGSTGDLDFFGVELLSPTDTPEIDGTALPLMPPDFAAFQTAEMAFVFPDGSTATADLTSLPEPASAAGLLGVVAGLGLLGSPRRKICC